MLLYGREIENRRMKAFTLFCCTALGLATVDAFYTTKPSSSLRVSVATRASLSSTQRTNIGFADDERRSDYDNNAFSKPRREYNPKYGSPMTFQQYLKSMAKDYSSKWIFANEMDRELKRMEMITYNIDRYDEDHPLHHSYATVDPSGLGYRGKKEKPDDKCYASVCNAFANSGHGELAGQAAEEVFDRFQQLTSQKPNSRILSAVMKAWVNLDNWEKADFWLKTIEDKFNETGDISIAPDCITYTTYLSGLSKTQTLSPKEARDRALEILEKMRDQCSSGKNPTALPNRYAYSYAMKIHERASSGYECVESVEKLYRQLEEDYRTYGGNSLKPYSVVSMNLFHACAHCRGGTRAAAKAEEFLEECQQRFVETNDEAYQPLEGMYTCLFSAFSKVPQEDAQEYANKVDRWLAEMKRFGIVADKFSMTAAINAKVNVRSEESVREGEEMMRQMQEPDAIAYQCLILAYKRIGMAAKANDLEMELKSLSGTVHNQHSEGLSSNLMQMGGAIHAWSRDKTVDTDFAIEKSEELLQKIITQYREGQVRPDEKQVDSWVFEFVIRLWSESSDPAAMDRIDALYNDMKSLQELAPGRFRPTATICLLILDSWAKSGRRDCGKKAFAILEEVESLHAKGEMPAPNIRMLSTTLVSLTRSKGPGMHKLAEGLYRTIIKKYHEGDRSTSINTRTLTTLLTMLLTIPGYDSAQRALRILREAIELGKDSIPDLAPNTIVFNSVLTGLSQRADSDEAWALLQEMKELHSKGSSTFPDSVSYHCVVNALAHDKNPESARRLMEVTTEILDLLKTGDLIPDMKLLNALLSAHGVTAKYDPVFADKAEEILTLFETTNFRGRSVKPSLESYSMVCRAFANSKDPDATQHAENILLRSKDMYAKGKIAPPGTEIYSHLVLAYSKRGDIESLKKAESLIEEMESSSKAGNKHMQPETYTYNQLLSSCGCFGELEIATQVFDKMKLSFEEGNTKCFPDTRSHNWVILTAARSAKGDLATKRTAFEVALEKFKGVHDENVPNNPDSATYEFFLQALFRLLPPGETRIKLVTKTMELAKNRGLVTGQICREAYKSAPNIILEMLGTTKEESEGNLITIPSTWSENVPHKRRDRRVRLGAPVEKRNPGFSKKEYGP